MLVGHITFLFPYSVLIQYVFYIDSTSQMYLDSFRGLGSHVWLMLAVLDSVALSYPRGNTGRKLGVKTLTLGGGALWSCDPGKGRPVGLISEVPPGRQGWCFQSEVQEGCFCRCEQPANWIELLLQEEVLLLA